MFDWKLLKEKKVLISFVIGFIIGLPIDGQVVYNSILTRVTPLEWREGQKGLIDPLLGVNFPDNSSFTELKPLEDSFSLTINQEVKAGNVFRASLYFRDMSSGHWASFNDSQTYAPASLVKIPMMISYFKVAETDPTILNKEIRYMGPDENPIQYYKPSQSLTLGQSYTVSELIRRMIVYSDNNAIQLLFDNMDKQTLGEIFNDLSISVPQDVNNDPDYITPGDFSRFFRILYNATYLDTKYSQEALTLLSQSEFDSGLVAGVPAGTVVANKFGEAPDVDQNGKTVSYELHDCGIIYYPSRPYLLCVMTVGPSLEASANLIKKISSISYEEVRDISY